MDPTDTDNIQEQSSKKPKGSKKDPGFTKMMSAAPYQTLKVLGGGFSPEQIDAAMEDHPIGVIQYCHTRMTPEQIAKALPENLWAFARFASSVLTSDQLHLCAEAKPRTLLKYIDPSRQAEVSGHCHEAMLPVGKKKMEERKQEKARSRSSAISRRTRKRIHEVTGL